MRRTLSRTPDCLTFPGSIQLFAEFLRYMLARVCRMVKFYFRDLRVLQVFEIRHRVGMLLTRHCVLRCGYGAIGF